MTDDVVAELDDWLAREATTLKHYPADDVDTGLLQRARDEIVALREKHVEVVEFDLVRHARTQALEEAARMCEGGCTTGSTASTLKAVAAVIRKLKSDV